MVNALEVDAKAWFIARLNATLPGVRVSGDVPSDAAEQVPFVRVVRVGGGDDGLTVDSPTLVLHHFHTSEPLANALAYQVGTAMRGLRGVVADGGTAQRVRKTGGPTWVAYENTGLQQVVTTWQTRIRNA